MGTFEDLEVWNTACEISIEVYRLLRTCKDYGLRDQMTRAAVSIASNIAEGAERGSVAEFVRFLHIAKGSVAELRTQLYIASQIDIIPTDDASRLSAELKVISKKLHSLINHLKLKT